VKKPFARFGFTESKRYYHINLFPNSDDFVPVIERLKRETVERSSDMVPELASRYVLAVFAALGVVQLAVLAYVFVRRRRISNANANAKTPGGRARENGDGRESADGWAVRCPECGASNDSRFRYCRQCVTELPDPDTASLALGDGHGQQS
jgi:hypothetical protein